MNREVREMKSLWSLSVILMALALGRLASASGSERSVASNTAVESGRSSATPSSSVEIREDPRSEAQDLFGFDRGPKGDVRKAYKAGMRGHPLYYLCRVAPNYAREHKVEYFVKQTGLKGRELKVTMDLANEMIHYEGLHGHLYTDQERIEENERAIEERRIAIEKKADEFFKVVPRGRRIKIYRVAEEHFAASALAMMAASSSDYGSTPEEIVEIGIADEMKRKTSDIYRMFVHRSLVDAKTAKLKRELAEAVEVCLGYGVIPKAVRKMPEEKQRDYAIRLDERRKEIVKSAAEIDID